MGDHPRAAVPGRGRERHAASLTETARSPHRVGDTVEDQIVAIRKELDQAGHDNGPQTIAFHLHQRHGTAPSPSTIWRILSRRGFVIPEPHKRPKSSYRRFEADQPNERWQLDTTHWALADGTEVEILNQLDDHSRLLVGSDARVTFKAVDVVTYFRKAAATWGYPAQMLSDNGAIFTGIPRRGGRVALELELISLGVRFRHSRPYHPQTCGKVERLHQTLKRWLVRQPRARTLRGLQAQLDRFRHYYNAIRPHRALGRRTPLVAFEARPKATPTGAAIADSHYRVRQDRADTSGVITLRYDSRLHHIGLGRRYAAQRPNARPRPPHPRPHRRRRHPPRPHPRPQPRLPTPAQNVNDVARHVCTMSRDIT